MAMLKKMMMAMMIARQEREMDSERQRDRDLAPHAGEGKFLRWPLE